MLGLNKYEETIYECLVKNGSLTAGQIHKKTNVPQNRIYDVVVSLEKNGFIEVQLTEPKVFRAIEPKLIFKKAKKELEKKEKDLQKLFKKRKVSEIGKQVWLTHGYKAAIRARFKEFSLAKKKICALVGKDPQVTTSRLTMISREHKKALKKIKTYFLWNMSYKENIEKAKRVVPYGAKVKHYPHEGFSMIVIDGKIVRLEFPDKQFERIIVWIENKKFAKSMEDYFWSCWKKGKNWKKFL